MATYKIPQDVEAEDKLLGPFTFRQFIFLLVAAGAAFVGWIMIKFINPWMVLIPLPAFLLFGFLGVYHREDQPVEIYLLAALNFFLKPHKRIWDPEGATENLRIVTPPRQEKPKIKRLESEERGQLERLAHIMDTRGWSTKRPELNEANNRESISIEGRLVAPLVSKSDQEPLDIHSSDDLLDPINFPDAQKFRILAENSTREARSKAIAGMKQVANKNLKSEIEHLKYQPYPQGAKQTHLDPRTGKLRSKKSVKMPKLSEASFSEKLTSHLSLAKNRNLSVQDIAQHAQRFKNQDNQLRAGQEIDLHL